jgi:hypothetical protein
MIPDSGFSGDKSDYIVEDNDMEYNNSRDTDISKTTIAKTLQTQ